MITWHPTGVADSFTAPVTVGGVTIAILHARKDAWQIQHVGGVHARPASSVMHAKRAALEALAELLPTVQFEIDAALRRL